MNIEKLKAYVRTASWRQRRKKSAPARPKRGLGSGERIIAAIIIRVTEMNTSCSSWRIGLTHEPERRKADWKKTENVDCWTQWEAASLPDALNIERYFINEKRMDGVTDEALSPNKPVFVYIF